MTFYERLSELLELHKMNAKDLAIAVGFTASSITGWKKNDSYPRADLLIKIAEVLDTTPEYLITGEMPAIDSQAVEMAKRIIALPPEYQKIVKDLITSFELILLKN